MVKLTRPFLWVFIGILGSMWVVLSPGAAAYPGFVSGTPLLPRVPQGTPLARSSISARLSSLLGAGPRLPLQDEFYVTLFNSSGMRRVTADLRYPEDPDVPTGVNIYVENGINVTDAQIRTIASEFTNYIRPIINDYFGQEPDIDGNGQVTLLITTLDASHIAGYFDARNQYSNQWVTGSNEREIIFINSRLVQYGVNAILGTLAHEFTHLVHWNYDRDEDVWFNEGMSMYAEFVVGRASGRNAYVDFSTIHAFLRSHRTTSLINWEQRYENYGAAYAFMLYLDEHYSPGNLRQLFQDPRPSLESLEDYLSMYGVTLSDVFGDWAVANAFDLPQVRYGYTALAAGIPPESLTTENEDLVGLPAWTARYLQLAGWTGPGLGISARGEAGLTARLVMVGADGMARVVSLEPTGSGLEYETASWSDNQTAILVVANTGEDQQVRVSVVPVSPEPATLYAGAWPDLLLPGRYVGYIRVAGKLGAAPAVTVRGVRGEIPVEISRYWDFSDQSLYITDRFDIRDVDADPGSVTMHVTAISAGKEIKVQEPVSGDGTHNPGQIEGREAP